MTTTIARILRHIGNLFFDTAERIHPIDNQPLGMGAATRTITLEIHGDGEAMATAFKRAYDQN